MALASGAAEQPDAYLLVAVDGTWQQANEMFKVRALPCRALMTLEMRLLCRQGADAALCPQR